jgi:UDP-4-amino-4,6-dideoxy-N-acetyl-beta-L-altrosamine transaminase
MKPIPYGKQSLSPEDINAVLKVLQSDWLTQGPNIQAFEAALAEYCGVKYAAAVMNATAALHLACLALEVGESDIVWTSSNTFLASANCARYCGAAVDFVDICSKTYNMSIKALEEKLQQAAEVNKLPKVVIPVHFAGQSCNMKAIRKLSDEYGFKIIEDASHAVGGRYENLPIGHCQYSDMTVFSFHPVKIITTAEGGMVVSNQKALIEKIKLLRSHGMTRDEALMEKPSEGAWYYEQVDLGFNYRITDMQCALGLSQLKQLDEFVQKRHALVERYHQKLKDLPLILPYQASDNYSAYHLYVIQVDPAKTHKKRKEVFDYLRQANIGVNVHYIPVHLQPYYQRLGFKKGDYPKAEHYYDHVISLPLYYSLSEDEQDYVVEKITEALQ